MSVIRRIREKIAKNEYEFAIPHFFEEMANDDFTFEDVKKAVANGVIKRKYTRDPRGTRYEVVGHAADGRAIAVMCRIKSTGKLLFITTYEAEDA